MLKRLLSLKNKGNVQLCSFQWYFLTSGYWITALWDTMNVQFEIFLIKIGKILQAFLEEEVIYIVMYFRCNYLAIKWPFSHSFSFYFFWIAFYSAPNYFWQLFSFVSVLNSHCHFNLFLSWVYFSFFFFFFCGMLLSYTLISLLTFYQLRTVLPWILFWCQGRERNKWQLQMQKYTQLCVWTCTFLLFQVFDQTGSWQ